MNTTYNNNTTTGVIQVHVQFNSSAPITNPYLILNVLSVFNTGNLTGNFTMSINQSARAGGQYLPSSYSTYLKVYMKHNLQTNSSLGTLILDNTSFVFSFYHSNSTNPMYYIGFNYSKPPAPPPPIKPNAQIQQYVNFTMKPTY